MDFISFTVFRVIELWCFGKNLRILRQNGVPGFMLVFSVGRVGQKTCFEATFVFLNWNFYGPTEEFVQL